MENKHDEAVHSLVMYFNNFVEISIQIRDTIQSGSYLKTFAKGKFIDSPLEYEPKIYFIINVAVRGFVRYCSREITTRLGLEDTIIGLTNFEKFKCTKRELYIQAVEKTDVLVIPFGVVMNLFTLHKKMSVITRCLLWQYYQELDECNIIARLPKAEDRVKRLRNNQPEIINRISSKYVADYLCMRLETLSRIKARLIRSYI